MYKVLKNNLTSPFQDFTYELGKEYHCDDFDDNPENHCSKGFYATGIEGILYSFRNNEDYKVFECEVSGRSVEIDQFKMRYENIKLIREIPLEELKELVKEETKRLDYDLYHAMFPVNPLLLPKVDVTDRHIELLKEWIKVREFARVPVWNSAWNSVQNSVWRTVCNSVQESVQESVYDSVHDSVQESVHDSVQESVWDFTAAYTSSLFPNIKKWGYIEHEEGINPFQPAIDLWNDGFVASFDGKILRLHQGENAQIVFEMKDE